MGIIEGISGFADIFDNWWYVVIGIGGLLMIALIVYFGYVEFNIYIMPIIRNSSITASLPSCPVCNCTEQMMIKNMTEALI